jgi:hypothetical protein
MKLINSLHKLPLNTFIDCICDSDFTGLVIEGEPNEQDLSLVWNDLLEQYSDALNDEGSRRYILVFKEYQQAKIKHDLIITYIEMLNNYYVPKWANELNKMVQSSFDFKAALDKDVEEYRKLLSRCFNRNKSNLMRYQLAQSKLEEITKLQSTDGKKPDRAFFTKVMVNLKNKNSREIPYDIPTYEFCVLVNDYRDYISFMETQKKK